MNILPSLEFISFLLYLPRSRTNTQTSTQATSQDFCYAVKGDRSIQLARADGGPGRRVWAIQHVVEQLKHFARFEPLSVLFADTPTLVPVPRSTLARPNTIYPTRQICDAMVRQGLGSEMRELLVREAAVPKAAAATDASMRPTVERHYQSLSVKREVGVSSDILLVDDVITQGRTVLACASRIQEAYPSATIRAFALFRTLRDDNARTILSITPGTVSLLPNGNTHREP